MEPACSHCGSRPLVQAQLLERSTEPVVLVALGHDHVGLQESGGGERFPGQEVQFTPRSVELTRHDRCDVPPAEHLDAVRQFENGMQCDLSSLGWKRQKRSRERTPGTPDNGLTQTEVPVPRGEHPVLGPRDGVSQQRRKRLVVNQDGQRYSSLIGKFGIAETRPRRFPVGVGKELASHSLQPAGYEQD